MTDEEFKYFLNLGLKFMVEKKKVHGKMAWLADTIQLKALLSEEWAAKDWNPGALSEGIRHVAFVLPRDAFMHEGLILFLMLFVKGLRKIPDYVI